MPRDGPATKRSAVRRTNLTACTRCRSRKQRCDQDMPACGNCSRAGVECVSLDLDGNPVPRSYVKQLENKIEQLEQRLQQSERQEASGGTTGPTSHCASLEQQGHYHRPSQPAGLAPSMPDPEADRIINESLNIFSESDMFPDEPAFPSPRLPVGDTASILLNAYFEHSNRFSPILSRRKLTAILQEEEHYGNIDEDPRSTVDAPNDDTKQPLQSQLSPATKRFVKLLVFATAELIVSRKGTSGMDSSRAHAYFAQARIMAAKDPSLLYPSSIQSLENISLMTQFLFIDAKLKPAWYLMGIASRLAIELGLHRYQAHDLSVASGNDVCWLFWAVYTGERVLNQVMDRPFSLSDEAITAPLPMLSAQDDIEQRRVGLALIQLRQMVSESVVTLLQAPPRNGAVLDLGAWRKSMLLRIQAWYTMDQLQNATESHSIIENDICLWYCRGLVILVLYPTNDQAIDDKDSVVLLANVSAAVIEKYTHTFTRGQMTYYWRGIFDLHRAGAALIYCINFLATLPYTGGLSLERYRSVVRTGHAIIWGMAERYPPGAVYRDSYETLLSKLDQPTANVDDTAMSAAPVDVNIFFSLDGLDSFHDT